MNMNIGDVIVMNGNRGEIVKFNSDANNDEFVNVLYDDGAYKTYLLADFMQDVADGYVTVEEGVW